MATKTNTTTATTATNKAAEVSHEATEKVTDAIKTMTSLFGALTQSTRKYVEGVIEVDKALLGYAKEAVVGFYDHGRQSVQAKDLNGLIDLQAAYAHNRIEATAANAREVVDLTRTKAMEAYAPVQEVFGNIYPSKKTAA